MPMPLLLLLPLLPLLACGDKTADDTAADGSASQDGGAAADGGAGGDGGSGDGGADGGSGDGGSGDGGAEGACDALVYFEGDLALATQTGLSPFCESYNAVRGDLYVDVGSAEDPITELDGIACLCEVTGDLVITGDSALEPPPEGTPAPGARPPHVTGDIELSLLERVGGDLVLTHHPSLSYVEGMRGLKEVGGDLRIAHNPEMQVASFYALERLGGVVSVQDMDKQLILRLPEATSIGGIELGASGDDETLWYFVELRLDVVEEITGDLRVYGPRNLALLGAPLLQRVGGTLQLEGSCITDLGFPALAEVGALRLVGNCGLLDLDGLAALRRVTGQDLDGTSIEIAGSDYLDEDEVAAFLSQLESQGTGTASVQAAGPCAETIARYAADYCD